MGGEGSNMGRPEPPVSRMKGTEPAVSWTVTPEGLQFSAGSTLSRPLQSPASQRWIAALRGCALRRCYHTAALVPQLPAGARSHTGGLGSGSAHGTALLCLC